MKVLLIQPPIQDFYQTEARLQPIGLGYLKAAARKHLPGVQVKIRDYHQGFGRRSIPLPRELAYLRDFYPCADTSPFGSFYQYYHFGEAFEEIACAAAEEKPDLIGISALFSPYYREVLRTAELLREHCDAPILVGGSHASAAPETLLNSPAIDFVVRGEGERPFVQLLRALGEGLPLRSVPGLIFRENGRWEWNPIEANYALQEIPFPDLSDLDAGRYHHQGRPMSFLVTSRSCPHRCSFCAVHLTFGTHYQRRPAEDIFQEILLRHREGIRVIDFEDDNLTYFLPEMKALCRRLIDTFAPGEMEFLAMNGISYHSLDRELLGLMRQAGFSQLNLSLVSSDDAVRHSLRRPHSRAKYQEMVTSAADLGFQIVSYQILGLPEETLESMIDTFCIHARLPVLLGASIFYLTPGTPLAATQPAMSESAIFRSRLTAMAFPTQQCSRQDLYTLFTTSRIVNFLKGLTLDEEQADLRTALLAASRDGGRNALGAGILEQLLGQGVLMAANRNGRTPLTRFSYPLFRKIWNQAGFLLTLQHRKLLLNPIP